MNKRRFLPGVGHCSRAIFFMLAVWVFYCFYFWLLSWSGVINNTLPAPAFTALLLLPLLPVAAFDLWLRITWEPEFPALHPPPPTLTERLLQREYGLYWFPIVICPPLWVWVTAIIVSLFSPG